MHHVISVKKKRNVWCLKLINTGDDILMSHLIDEALNISLLIQRFCLRPSPATLPISFYLLFSVNLNSCLMRRSRTAKRMSPAGWVPAAALCSASAARSADADVIRYLTAEEAEETQRAVHV